MTILKNNIATNKISKINPNKNNFFPGRKEDISHSSTEKQLCSSGKCGNIVKKIRTGI
jgi:hypothetical protein